MKCGVKTRRGHWWCEDESWGGGAGLVPDEGAHLELSELADLGRHRAAEAAGSHASERSGVCTEHAVAHVSSLGVSFARGAGAGCLRGVCRFTGEARTGSYVAHR